MIDQSNIISLRQVLRLVINESKELVPLVPAPVLLTSQNSTCAMAYFSNLFTSSPPTSSQDEVFCILLSRRARTITPGLSLGLSSLGSSPTRERLIEHSPPPKRSESDNTGFDDAEVNNSDVSFTSQVSFQDSEGNRRQHLFSMCPFRLVALAALLQA
jgi:hypothetical protein